MFSGNAHHAFTGRVQAGSFGSQVKLHDIIREERGVSSASVEKEIDRACLRVTTRTSEVDMNRSRQHEVREGPRVVRILGAEKASARAVHRRMIARS